MPLRPAASITENARYGLHAGSGERNSMRVELSLPFFGSGTRTSADRLLRAQHTYTGASYPTISRLYELTVWFVTAVISRAWLSSPAMKALPDLRQPVLVAGVVERVDVALEQREVRVHPRAERAGDRLGHERRVHAEVACATSFTTIRNVMTLSAIVSASV